MSDKHLTLEVLYIGQSYGEDGSSTAVDRLLNHETAQKIFGESQAQHPDKEIWYLLWNIKSQWIVRIDGSPREFQTTDIEDDYHSSRFLNDIVPDKLEINLAEAALIKYFQPEFNVKFKHTFPDKEHLSYAQCYQWDLHTIIAEVDTEELGMKLGSSTVAASFHHTAVFPFHSEAEREAVFNI
jgi:hypothetical protein